MYNDVIMINKIGYGEHMKDAVLLISGFPLRHYNGNDCMQKHSICIKTRPRIISWTTVGIPAEVCSYKGHNGNTRLAFSRPTHHSATGKYRKTEHRWNNLITNHEILLFSGWTVLRKHKHMKFLSFLYNKRVEEVKTFPHVRQIPVCPT